uniref:uncharacterized protein LOC122585219 n=1 Tax=Erigeron canadensis TaxID=72917 RepID=UPI001CB8F65D|nr:uncharacterized protein LOC122585219 [Erigeron canadensis]
MKRGKAKVSWKSVCLPKNEGELGIIRIATHNKALLSNHIWSILTNRESLWVKWVHSYRLKGRSFWAVSLPGSCSWGWRKLLQLREEIRPFIWSKFGHLFGPFMGLSNHTCLLSNLQLNDSDDMLCWKDQNGDQSKFATGTVWHTLKRKEPMVQWHKVAWLFTDKVRPVGRVIALIKEMVRLRLVTLKFKNTPRVVSLLEDWKLPKSIMFEELMAPI